MVDGFYANMNPVDFLSLRIHQLERCPEDLEHAAIDLKKAWFKSKAQFEYKFCLQLQRKGFLPGELVLVQNTRVEKEFNRKTKPQYLGPFIVECQTKGGSYVLREINGTLSRHGVAAFRLVPYTSRDLTILSSLSQPLHEHKEEQDIDHKSQITSSEEELVLSATE
jgi:hypothetical protein